MMLMAKTNQKTKRKTPRSSDQFDGVYLFKMVLYLLLGSMWIKNGDGSLGIPIGLMIGLIFTTHEHFRIDRKIEYAVLVVAMLIGFFAPFGLYIDF